MKRTTFAASLGGFYFIKNMDLQQIAKSSDAFRDQLRQELSKQLSSPSPLEADEPLGFQSPGITFGGMAPATKTTDYLKAGVGWVYACVAAIADACASTELQLFKLEKGEVTEVTDHPILDLLNKVNPFQTEFDHRWLSQQYLELAGEAPWFIDRGLSGSGEPQNIMLLMPDKLTLVKAADGQMNPIAKYVYKLDAEHTFEIKPEEMVYIKYPDPTNPWRGKGTLAAAASIVDIDSYSEEYNKNFFYNSATPNSVISTDQKLTPKQREELNRSIRKMYQGKENAHKTALLESGLKWEPMQMSQRDMDFIEQQRFSMAKILSIFRVPKPIVAISDDVNLANAKIAEYVFSKWTIRPKMRRLVSQLNEFFLPMFSGSEGLFLSFADPVPQDTELDLKRYQTGLASGYLTINEVRREQGLEEIGTEGDTIYLPFSLQPIGSSSNQEQNTRSIKAGNLRSPRYYKSLVISNSGNGYRLAVKRLSEQKRSKEVKGRAVKQINQRIDELAMSIAKQLVQRQWQNKVQKAKAIKEAAKKAAIDSFVSMYLKASDQYEKSFIGKVTEQFDRQLKAVLAQAPKKTAKAVNLDDWLLDEENEAEIMVGVFTPELRQVVTEQGKRAGLLVGMGDNFNAATRAVQAYLKKRTYQFSFEMTQETNTLIGKALKLGVANGESIPDIRKRVERVFKDMEKYRSERIARSEVVRASNFATMEAYEQSGVVEKMEWLVTSDDRLCPLCEPLDGKSVKLGDSFFDKGDRHVGADGSELDLDYETIEHPPLHPNCRCTIVPIVAGTRGYDPKHQDLREKKAEAEELVAELEAKQAELEIKLTDLQAKEKQLQEQIEGGEIRKKLADKEAKALRAERKKLEQLRQEIIADLNGQE